MVNYNTSIVISEVLKSILWEENACILFKDDSVKEQI